MSRYIDADKYEQDLRRMTEIVHETGHAPDISGELVKSLRAAFIAGVKAAITQLSVEPGWERTDIRYDRIAGIRGIPNDCKEGYLTAQRQDLARAIGKYAADEGDITMTEDYDNPGRGYVKLRACAAFLQPIEPKFKPGEDSGEEEQEWTTDETS